jgi:predicted GIY-YIG superfamily endonuclease
VAKDRAYWVYILASKIGGTLYIGVTGNLVKRVYEHRLEVVPGFTKEYGVHRLSISSSTRKLKQPFIAKRD